MASAVKVVGFPQQREEIAATTTKFAMAHELEPLLQQFHLNTKAQCSEARHAHYFKSRQKKLLLRGIQPGIFSVLYVKFQSSKYKQYLQNILLKKNNNKKNPHQKNTLQRCLFSSTRTEKKKNQQQKIFQKYFSSKLAYSLLFQH